MRTSYWGGLLSRLQRGSHCNSEGKGRMTSIEAKHLPRLTVVVKDSHPGIVAGIAHHGLFVIWQGKTGLAM